MDVPLDRLMIFNPNTGQLYSASELSMVMNGQMLQLNLPTTNSAPVPTKKKRKVSRYQREFGRQYRMLDDAKRLRNGSYRSGWDRARIMSKAHKETRKALGMK